MIRVAVLVQHEGTRRYRDRAQKGGVEGLRCLGRQLGSCRIRDCLLDAVLGPTLISDVNNKEGRLRHLGIRIKFAHPFYISWIV